MPEPNEDSSQAKPVVVEGEENQNLENQDKQVQSQQPQSVDWESEANPYKRHYQNSQSQIQPLLRMLHQFADYDHSSKSWKPKTQSPITQKQVDDIEQVLSGYDPDFTKALIGYIKKEITSGIEGFRKESASLVEYNSIFQSSRAKAVEEFGNEFEFVKNGKFNTESPLYILANQILTDKYAQFNPDGSFHKYINPEAEYLATVEAYAILSKKSKQTSQADKAKLAAIQGKGTVSAGTKKRLSPEDYMKLTDEQKDAYDAQTIGV